MDERPSAVWRGTAALALLVVSAGCAHRTVAEPERAGQIAADEPRSSANPDAASDRTAPPEWERDDADPADATLHLRLVGDPGGQPVTMRVRLWRLGLPETERWTAGDQPERDVHVPEAGAALRLPAGRYRLQVPDRRWDTVDPPEFTLPAGTTEREVAVANRRDVRFRLRIIDEEGRPVREAGRKRLGGGSSSSRSEPPAKPDWATARSPKFFDERWLTDPRRPYGSVGTSCGTGDAESKPALADADGFFDLGTHRERGQDGHADWAVELVPSGRATVTVRADDTICDDTTYVAVAPHLDALLALVDRPDGEPLDPARVRITATCAPLRCDWNAPPDLWRTLAVEAYVVCDGFLPLTFDWSPATAGARHSLLPAK